MYDALLVVSFGGPEAAQDVMPFLRNVVRGRGVPEERLLAVAEHYYALGGKSPIQDQCRALIAALSAELRAHAIDLPIYWGNRNWQPLLADTLRQMRDDGVRHALAYVTSAFSSYSGCRQYLENLADAAREVGEGAPRVDKLRGFYNHPGFVDAVTSRVRDALATLPERERDAVRLVFTAHSIPVSMAQSSPYVAQLAEISALVAERLGHAEHDLVYQSRSGPPQVPWLEPDILAHLRQLAREGATGVLLVPLGFVSDHMEVVWDLDHEARKLAEELGLAFARAATVGTHPAFVSMLRELVQERLGQVSTRRVCGPSAARPDVCPDGCCAYQARRPGA